MEETFQQNNINSIISEWVDKYAAELITWAHFKTSDKMLAEDLVQDTFVAAYRSFDSFKGTSSPKTWLFSILNNKIHDHHRKKFKNIVLNESQINLDINDKFFSEYFDENDKWKEEERPGIWDDSTNPADDPAFMAVLADCMKHLPALWNSAINLKYITEKNAADICQELNITTSNYWQILHRAKLQLRKCIDNNWFEK